MDECFSLNGAEAEVFYDELLAHKAQKYRFRILNWRKPERRQHKGNYFNIVKAVSLDDYPELKLSKGQQFNLHLAIKSFNRAWTRIIQYHKVGHMIAALDVKEVYFIDLSIRRLNHKTVDIDDLRVIQFNGEGQEKPILQILENELVQDEV